MTRLLDFIFSLCGLIVLSPLFLVLYVLIRMESKGGGFYSQERVGLNGVPFRLYKFRSMRVGSDLKGLITVGERDNRITRTGLFIRKYKLDELPQLWNVLRGDMSLVGPRPERQYYIDKIMEKDSRYSLIYQMRPGLTSEATLYNGYTDTMEKMLRRLHMDLYYLEHRSLWLDCKIIIKTAARMLGGVRF